MKVRNHALFTYLSSRCDIDEGTGCWLWSRAISNGYGVFKHNKKTYRAHRGMWLALYGAIPEKFCICHKCDVPNCINPEHLFLGTQKENFNDALSKARLILDKILEESDIRRIWILRNNGLSLSEIAREIKKPRHNVKDVIRFKTWKALSYAILSKPLDNLQP